MQALNNNWMTPKGVGSISMNFVSSDALVLRHYIIFNASGMSFSKRHRNKKPNYIKKATYIIGALAVIAFISLIPFQVNNVSQKEVLDLPNLPTEDGFVHWHTELDIIINGRSLVIPANIGIRGSEHAVVHTHEADNILHIEQFPNESTMTVGYFFEIWADHINKTVTFNNTCILDKCNDSDSHVVFTVNGERNEEFGDYVMQDGDIIRIEYKKRADIIQAN